MQKKPSIPFLIILFLLIIIPEYCFALTNEPDRITLGRGRTNRSLNLGNQSYQEIASGFKNQPYSFNNSDFVEHNWIGLTSIRNTNLDFYFLRNSDSSKTTKYWILGLGTSSYSIYSDFTLKLNELVSNSNFEKVSISYYSRNIDFTFGHSWSSNPENKIRGSVDIISQAGIPTFRSSTYTLQSFYYPSGSISSFLETRFHEKPNFALLSQLGIHFQISTDVYKEFEAFIRFGGSFQSLHIFQNTTYLNYIFSYSFGIGYRLNSNL